MRWYWIANGFQGTTAIPVVLMILARLGCWYFSIPYAIRPRLHARLACLLVLCPSAVLRSCVLPEAAWSLRTAACTFLCLVLSSCTPPKAASSLSLPACTFVFAVLTSFAPPEAAWPLGLAACTFLFLVVRSCSPPKAAFSLGLSTCTSASAVL